MLNSEPSTADDRWESWLTTADVPEVRVVSAKVRFLEVAFYLCPKRGRRAKRGNPERQRGIERDVIAPCLRVVAPTATNPRSATLDQDQAGTATRQAEQVASDQRNPAQTEARLLKL